MIIDGTWDRTVPALSDDALMLAESDHRVRNELAAAIAAMRLVKAAKGTATRWRLLESAIARLEAFGDLHRQLSIRATTVMDLGEELDSLCRSIAVARFSKGGAVLDLTIAPLRIDVETGRRVLLIAAELLTNAIKHAMRDRQARIGVTLAVFGPHVTLIVDDDGPGIDPASASRGTGMGTPLVGELVARAGGRIVRESGPEGTSCKVCLPFDPATMERARAA